jgi:chemotaxis protein CheX
VKAEFINPFLSAITNILVTMATLPVTAGKAHITRSDMSHADITGMMHMKSPQTEGTLAISFPREVILDIAFRMLGEKFETIDDSVTDLVGEITNMVTGQAKQLLSEKGFDFDMARPTVIRGEQPIEMIAALPAIVVPFTCEKGEFYVEICFTPNH